MISKIECEIRDPTTLFLNVRNRYAAQISLRQAAGVGTWVRCSVATPIGWVVAHCIDARWGHDCASGSSAKKWASPSCASISEPMKLPSAPRSSACRCRNRGRCRHLRQCLPPRPMTEMKELLENDDTIWLGFDGGAWREPGDSAGSESAAAERGHVEVGLLRCGTLRCWTLEGSRVVCVPGVCHAHRGL